MAELKHPDGRELQEGDSILVPNRAGSLNRTRSLPYIEYFVQHVTKTQVRAMRAMPESIYLERIVSFRKDSGLLIGGYGHDRKYGIVATPEMVEEQARIRRISNFQNKLATFSNRMGDVRPEKDDAFWLGLADLAGDYLDAQLKKTFGK